MKITLIENGQKPKAFLVHALLGTQEFEQLQGSVTGICAFATKTIMQPTTYTKTGSRHSSAKYLLLPAALRKQLLLSQYDFESMTCGTQTYRDSLYLIFKVPRIVPFPED